MTLRRQAARLLRAPWADAQSLAQEAFRLLVSKDVKKDVSSGTPAPLIVEKAAAADVNFVGGSAAWADLLTPFSVTVKAPSTLRVDACADWSVTAGSPFGLQGNLRVLVDGKDYLQHAGLYVTASAAGQPPVFRRWLFPVRPGTHVINYQAQTLLAGGTQSVLGTSNSPPGDTRLVVEAVRSDNVKGINTL